MTDALQTVATVKPLGPTSEASHSQISDSQVKRFYPAKMYKVFLQQTKGMKSLDPEKHFPDKLLFYQSAGHVIEHRATSDLTDQETYRLRKQMLRVKKQLDM